MVFWVDLDPDGITFWYVARGGTPRSQRGWGLSPRVHSSYGYHLGVGDSLGFGYCVGWRYQDYWVRQLGAPCSDCPIPGAWRSLGAWSGTLPAGRTTHGEVCVVTFGRW